MRVRGEAPIRVWALDGGGSDDRPCGGVDGPLPGDDGVLGEVEDGVNRHLVGVELSHSAIGTHRDTSRGLHRDLCQPDTTGSPTLARPRSAGPTHPSPATAFRHPIEPVGVT